MKSSVIVFGPPGCGKTRNAKILAKYFGLKFIKELDGVDGDAGKAPDTLYLTNYIMNALDERGRFRKVVAYKDVIRKAKAKFSKT